MNSFTFARSPRELDEPAGVDTVTTTWSVAVPAGSAGASALSSPSRLTRTLVAATPSKNTCGVDNVLEVVPLDGHRRTGPRRSEWRRG